MLEDEETAILRYAIKKDRESGLLGDIRDFIFPFKIGDRVSVTVDDFYNEGEITDISNSFDRGQGTKLYPAFLVLFDDGQWGWFNGVSLSRTMRSTS